MAQQGGRAGRDEKHEKQEEKDEKQRREKNRPSDALSSLAWGAAFVVAGIFLLLASGNVIRDFHLEDAWSIVLACAGVIFLIEVAIRLTMPAYRRPVTGTLIFAFVLLALAAGGAWGWDNIWPIFLVGVGVVILVGQIMRR